MEEENTTTIRIKESTKKRLESKGTLKDTFDTVINDLLDEVSKDVIIQ